MATASEGFCSEVGVSLEKVKTAFSENAVEESTSESDLMRLLNISEKLPSTHFTNGVVYELWNFIGSKCNHKNRLKSFFKIVATYFDIDVSNCIDTTVQSKLVKVVQTRRSLCKLKNKQKVCDFLHQESNIFKPPCKPSKSTENDNGLRCELDRLRKQHARLSGDFEKLEDRFKAQSELLREVLNERAILLEKTDQLEKDVNRQQQANMNNQRRIAQLGQASVQAIVRRDKRKKVIIREMRQQLREMKKKLNDNTKSKKLSDVERNKKLDSLKKKVSYYRKKALTLAADSSTQHKLDEVNAKLREREYQLVELEDRLNDMVQRENGVIKTIEKGKYKDNIRSVYQHLMCLNVGSNNCEDVVRTVLKGIAGLDVEKLPKASFARDMVFEARAMAQLQFCDAVLEEDNLTLCSDGTTKYGQHYGSFDIRFGAGNVFTLGVRKSADGTAVTTLEVLKEIIQDLVDLGGVDKERLDLGRFLTKIKNVMSDRHSVQKKFNSLLADFRGKFLPAVRDEWDTMSAEQREKATELNEFFCGLHFIVGLAEQASSTLKAWEQMIFGEERVGAKVLTGFSVKNESGTERLVRTVCEAVHYRGCAKSGKAAQFRAFLSAEHGVSNVPLAAFKGNRFNILFHNGGGVFHLYQHLLAFFSRHKSDNDLTMNVAADLDIPQYIAGVRSLGIIDKIITGPLWRTMEKEKHVLAMNERYNRLLQCLTEWSDDATGLLNGSEFLYTDVGVRKDAVYDSLTKPSREFDGMAKQLLEMLCSSFKMLVDRMLSDHLRGGRYASVTTDQHRQMQSVPTTNATVERDFGMLDHLMREKPSASTIALEAMIMYRRNKTSEWSASLEESQRAMFMKLAQTSKAQQRKAYADRLATIKSLREKRELAKKEAVSQKAQQDRVRKTLLVNELKAVGGFADSQSEIDQRLGELKSAKEKTVYLQTQLKYRKFVLGASNRDGILNLTVGGKSKSVEQLRSSLLSAINSEVQEVEAASCHRREKAIGLAPADAVEAFKGSRLHPPPAKKARPTSVAGKMDLTVKQLVGKRVEHHTEQGGHKGWHRGTVVGAKGGKYFIRYDRHSQVYSIEAEEIEGDLQSGNFRTLRLSPGDILNREVMHLWLIDDEEVWCEGVVVSFSKDDGNDTMFEILYVSNDDDDDGEDEVIEHPLLKDYLNHKVRFI